MQGNISKRTCHVTRVNHALAGACFKHGTSSVWNGQMDFHVSLSFLLDICADRGVHYGRRQRVAPVPPCVSFNSQTFIYNFSYFGYFLIFCLVRDVSPARYWFLRKMGIYPFTFALTCKGNQLLYCAVDWDFMRWHDLEKYAERAGDEPHVPHCHWRRTCPLSFVLTHTDCSATPYVCQKKLSDLCMIAYLATLITWKGYSRSFRIVNVSN